MTGVLAVIAPVYLAVAIGYVAVRTGFVPGSSLPVMGDFVMRVALPAMLFGALATRHITQLVDLGYLLVYALGSLAAMALGFFAARSLARREGLRARTVRLRSAYASVASGTSNSGYVGFPVLQGSLPAVAAPAFGMNVLVENLLTIPLGMALAERAAGGHASVRDLVRTTALRLARTPMILAIVAGAAVSLLGLPVPDVVARLVTMFANATTAPALFIIGGTLVGQRATGQLGAVAPIVVGKLLVHPLAVAGCAWALTALGPAVGLAPLDPALRAAAVVSAAAPTISILPVLAARHGEAESTAAASFVATVLSCVTLTATLLVVAP